MLTRVVAALALVCAAAIFAASPAYAVDCPSGTAPSPAAGGGFICIAVSDAGRPQEPKPKPKPDDPPSSASSTCTRADRTVTPCSNEAGVWSSAHQCYAHAVNVPAGHEAWGGHTDGAVWMCALIDDGVDPPTLFWVPSGGAPGGLPDPGELAEQAFGLLRLETARVQTAPEHPDVAIVGVETWMWVPESQWWTLTKTVRAGGTAVTVTAEPDHVVWGMGPEEKICYDAGRVWLDGMGDAATTTCGYTYAVTSDSQPDGLFDLSARIVYQVDWTCSGACTTGSGSLGLVEAPAGGGTLQVVQRQTVVIR